MPIIKYYYPKDIIDTKNIQEIAKEFSTIFLKEEGFAINKDIKDIINNIFFEIENDMWHTADGPTNEKRILVYINFYNNCLEEIKKDTLAKSLTGLLLKKITDLQPRFIQIIFQPLSTGNFYVGNYKITCNFLNQLKSIMKNKNTIFATPEEIIPLDD